MKRKILKRIKNVICMKKTIYSFVIVTMFGFALCFSACEKEEKKDNSCHGRGYLDCGSGQCCGKGYPIYGGNACWATMSGCRTSGYACDSCW